MKKTDIQIISSTTNESRNLAEENGDLQIILYSNSSRSRSDRC